MSYPDLEWLTKCPAWLKIAILAAVAVLFIEIWNSGWIWTGGILLAIAIVFAWVFPLFLQDGKKSSDPIVKPCSAKVVLPYAKGMEVVWRMRQHAGANWRFNVTPDDFVARMLEIKNLNTRTLTMQNRLNALVYLRAKFTNDRSQNFIVTFEGSGPEAQTIMDTILAAFDVGPMTKKKV